MTQPSEKPEDAIVNANAAILDGLGENHEEALELSKAFLEKTGPEFSRLIALLVGVKIKHYVATLAAKQAESYCKTCGAELEWTECTAPGCEDGQIDVYDSDPLWYDPGDTEPCNLCGGKGGGLECPNAEQHPR